MVFHLSLTFRTCMNQIHYTQGDLSMYLPWFFLFVPLFCCAGSIICYQKLIPIDVFCENYTYTLVYTRLNSCKSGWPLCSGYSNRPLCVTRLYSKDSQQWIANDSVFGLLSVKVFKFHLQSIILKFCYSLISQQNILFCLRHNNQVSHSYQGMDLYKGGMWVPKPVMIRFTPKMAT